MTLEEARFGGLVYEIAEKEFGGSFSEDENNQLINQIYSDYVEAGQPKNKKTWIRERLKTLFLCAKERPNWVEGRPRRLFLNGRPMVFVGQFAVPQNDMVREKLCSDDVLYFFGARDPIPEHGGFEMRYAVVSQNPEFRRLVMGSQA